MGSRELTPARGRPREFDPDEVLDRALPLFWRDGFEGASVSALAEAMGVSKPSLYAAFGDKEGLYLRALERYAQQQRDRHAAVLSRHADARSAVEALLLSVVDEITDPSRPGGCMVVSATASCDALAIPASVKAALCGALHAAEHELDERLLRAVQTGELSHDVDVTALSAYFNTVISGLVVQAKGGATRTALRAVVGSAILAWPALTGRRPS